MFGGINYFFSSEYLSGQVFKCRVKIPLGPCIHGCFQKLSFFFVASLHEIFCQMPCVLEFMCILEGFGVRRRLALSPISKITVLALSIT